MRKIALRGPSAVLACVALLACSAACGSSATAPSSTGTLTKTDLRMGTGAVAESGKTLTVNYTGWLYDSSKVDQKGLQFDSSVGGTPFSFTLGAGQVIPGWDQGLLGMQVGGVRRLLIPPSLGYGGVRNFSVPPYATLVFDVELLDVQ